VLVFIVLGVSLHDSRRCHTLPFGDLVLACILQSLLGEPNNASPLNGEAAEIWDNDPEEFKRKVLGRHRDVDDE